MNTIQKNAQLMKFKMIFEGQKKALLRANETARHEFSIMSDDLSDEADLTSVELEQGMRMKLREREATFLKKIDESLSKIQAGTFGVCECCEEDIEASRLEARPTADLCISCKENEEAMEHRLSDANSKRNPRHLRIA